MASLFHIRAAERVSRNLWLDALAALTSMQRVATSWSAAMSMRHS